MTPFIGWLASRAYTEPVRVCYRDDTVVRISTQFPALVEPRALLDTLGQPAATLDYYFSSMPVLNKQGEWVYADRGLTLLLSSDKDNVVEVMVYPPTTMERYKKELYYLETPREFEP